MKWNRDKKEIWQNDKTWLQQKKINFKLWFMKFNRQTHGMGMIFLLLIVVLIIIQVVNYFILNIDEKAPVTGVPYCWSGCVWHA